MKKVRSSAAKAKTVTSEPSNVSTYKGKMLLFYPLQSGLSEEWLKGLSKPFPEGFYLKANVPVTLPGEAWLQFVAQARDRECPITEVLSDALEENATWSGDAGSANREWLLRGDLKKRLEAIAKRKGRKPEDCLLEAVEQYVEAK